MVMPWAVGWVERGVVVVGCEVVAVLVVAVGVTEWGEVGWAGVVLGVVGWAVPGCSTGRDELVSGMA